MSTTESGTLHQTEPTTDARSYLIAKNQQL
jgi:hypothetical protein